MAHYKLLIQEGKLTLAPGGDRSEMIRNQIALCETSFARSSRTASDRTGSGS